MMMFFVYIISFSGIFSLQLASVFPASMSVFFLSQCQAKAAQIWGSVSTWNGHGISVQMTQ
jgi:hypothetical protein